MKEGWLDDDYIILFEERSSSLTEAYAIQDFLQATNSSASPLLRTRLYNLRANAHGHGVSQITGPRRLEQPARGVLKW